MKHKKQKIRPPLKGNFNFLRLSCVWRDEMQTGSPNVRRTIKMSGEGNAGKKFWLRTAPPRRWHGKMGEEEFSTSFAIASATAVFIAECDCNWKPAMKPVSCRWNTISEDYERLFHNCDTKGITLWVTFMTICSQARSIIDGFEFGQSGNSTGRNRRWRQSYHTWHCQKPLINVFLQCKKLILCRLTDACMIHRTP